MTILFILLGLLLLGLCLFLILFVSAFILEIFNIDDEITTKIKRYYDSKRRSYVVAEYYKAIPLSSRWWRNPYKRYTNSKPEAIALEKRLFIEASRQSIIVDDEVVLLKIRD